MKTNTPDLNKSENTSKKITLEDLIKKQEIQDFPYPNSPQNLQHVIDLLTEIPEFYIYSLQREGTPDFEIPYSIYGDIVFYLRYLVERKKYEIIKRIFTFLGKMNESNDKYTQDLLGAGVLENFDLITDILPDLIPLMPDNLKQKFTYN